MVFPFAQAEADIVSAHHLAVVVLPVGSDRSAVQQALRERGIQTSVHYPPIHLFTAYADAPAQRPLPRTEDVGRRVLTLPLFAHITDGQVEAVVESLTAAVAGA
jgi:dTDP-4-amino-4,6-dideoxygalactose transaminase